VARVTKDHRDRPTRRRAPRRSKGSNSGPEVPVSHGGGSSDPSDRQADRSGAGPASGGASGHPRRALPTLGSGRGGATGPGSPKSAGSVARGSGARRGKIVPGAPRETALVELRIRGDPVPHWMQEIGTRWGAGVRLHVCRRVGDAPGHLLQLLEINANPATISEITAFLRGLHALEELSLTPLTEDRLLVRLVSPLPPLCHTVFKMGAICMSCPFFSPEADPGSATDERDWRVLVHHAGDAHPLLTSYTAPGTPPPSLVRIGTYRGLRDLTARQELAVGTAFALGYFDTPRRAQLKDVAKALGVSRAAVMENLRRALRNLASQRHRGEVGVVRALESY
jgi:hypothetical protein